MSIVPTTPPEMAWFGELTPAAIGIWSVLGVVLVALIKAWPIISAQGTAAREKLRLEGRSDRKDYQTQIDELRQEVHRIEMKLLGTIGAYRILDTEVETHLPDSKALIQARSLMSAAFSMSPSTNTPFQMPEGL